MLVSDWLIKHSTATYFLYWLSQKQSFQVQSIFQVHLFNFYLELNVMSRISLSGCSCKIKHPHGDTKPIGHTYFTSNIYILMLFVFINKQNIFVWMIVDSVCTQAHILEFGLAVHEKFVPQDMKPLHKKLVDQFHVMRSSLGIQVRVWNVL